MACPLFSRHKQANQTLIDILTQDKFKITELLKMSGCLRFDLMQLGLEYLTEKYGPIVAVRHVKRHFIDTDNTHKIILIPKIACRYNNKLKYHVILPDFLIPYNRHVLKSFIAAIPSIVPDALLDNNLKEFDCMVDIAEDYPARRSYLCRHKLRILIRLKQIIKALLAQKPPLVMQPCQGFGKIARLYCKTAASTPVRTISYIMDSLWQTIPP